MTLGSYIAFAHTRTDRPRSTAAKVKPPVQSDMRSFPFAVRD